MKQDVIKFLANPPKNESEKFNKAVSLYRQSKDHDVTLVRFLNSMGFSKDRMDNVLYELKKLHSVSDLEVANARSAKNYSKPKLEKVEDEDAKKIEVNDAEDISTPLDVTEEATSGEQEATEEKPGETPEDKGPEKEQATSEKAEATEDASTSPNVTDEFKKKLAEFDVEAEKYNSIKSFAADVSDAIKADPKDQKGATLKAFILDAKKKYAQS